MPYRMTPSVRHRAIEVHYYYYSLLLLLYRVSAFLEKLKCHGKSGNFEMVYKVRESLLKITNVLPIRTQLKLNILNKYIHANLIDDLKIVSPGVTLIGQNLDSLCYSCVLIWLGLPPRACIKETLILSKKKCGFGISSFEENKWKTKTEKRFRLKNSNLP